MKFSMLRQVAIMALEYLRGRKLRTVLTTLSIVFGVTLIFSMNLLLPGAEQAFRQMVSSAAGESDVRITSTTGEAFRPEVVLQSVTSTAGVQAASGVLRRPISLPGTERQGSIGTASTVEIVGIDPATISAVQPYVISEGEFLKAGESGKVLMSASIADIAPELKVGTTFPLITTGGLKVYTVAGLFASSVASSAPQIVMTLADAQAAFNQPGLINTVEVALTAGADKDTVSAALAQALGSGFLLNAAADTLGILNSLQVGYAIFNVLGMFALFMGGFLIFNTFRTVVLERQRDLGMLRAIGATRRQLTQMLLIEGLIQGVVGIVIGLILGYLFALLSVTAIRQIQQDFVVGLNVTLSVSARSLLLPIILGLLTTLAAVYFPARAGGRVTPLQALRPARPADVQRAARWSLRIGAVLAVLGLLMTVANRQAAAGGGVLFLIGLVVMAPGLVAPVMRVFNPLLTLWFAREGDLARGNLLRQPGRAAVTASTLMIGLAVFIAIVGIVGSFETFVTGLVTRNFSSDILIVPPSIGIYNNVVGADDRLTEQIRALPDVETVAGLRYASSAVGGRPVQVLGIDPESYPKVSPLDFSQGVPEEAYAALLNERAAILNTTGAAALRLKVGDTIRLQTAEGEQPYRIVALATDMLSIKVNTLFISHANLKGDFHRAEDVMLMLNLKPGADKNVALAAVQGLLKDYPQFSAKITGEYRQSILDATVGGLGVFSMLGIVIVIPAALGLLNTLTINVLERTREIGIVRAVGGSRKQIRRMVLAEALLLGLFGVMTGILAGVVLSYGFTMAISNVGWAIPYNFPVIGLIAALVCGVILTLLASVLPARSAAKLDIIRALQYE